MNIELTPSQQLASEKLEFFFRLVLGKIDSIEGISPRPIPLIAGPSGSGKTFIVGQIAEKYELPMFCINAANWIVRGAKNDGQITMDQLHEFVAQNEKGVIFIDEVNKLRNAHIGDSSWSADVFSELLAFLDRDQRLESMGLSGLVEKLKNNFHIVGAAAFQDQWQESAGTSQSIGFVTDTEIQTDREHAYEQAIRNQEAVPEELLFRFNDRFIIILPPTADQFRKRILSLRIALSLPALKEEELHGLAHTAVQSDKCMRWLEGYLSECLSLLTPEALEALSTLEGEHEVPSDSPTKEKRAITTLVERKKMIAIRDACFERYEQSLGNLSTASRKLCLLLSSVLLAQKSDSDSLTPERLPICECLSHIGEMLSPDQPSEDYPAILIRGLDYLAFHGLKAPSSLISSKERGKISKGIRSVSGKIAEVLPVLITHCGNDLEGQEIRTRALELAVFTEKATFSLEELHSIAANGVTKQGS